MHRNDPVFRLLDDLTEKIGIFRLLQLLNEIENNNWRLAEKYPPVTAYQVHSLRTLACEYRLAMKPETQDHLTQKITIIKGAA